jgi:hypothetical protein
MTHPGRPSTTATGMAPAVTHRSKTISWAAGHRGKRSHPQQDDTCQSRYINQTGYSQLSTSTTSLTGNGQKTAEQKQTNAESAFKRNKKE